MYNAIAWVLQMKYEACVLIGSDIPELRPQDLRAAFAALVNNDVVLGPAADGGYYLVGMKKPHKVIFEDQTYGQGRVLQNTLAGIRGAGLTCALAPAHEDIDEPGDLFRYYERLIRREEPGNSHTAGYLMKIMGSLGKGWD